jgi:hypothetical protein
MKFSITPFAPLFILFSSFSFAEECRLSSTMEMYADKVSSEKYVYDHSRVDGQWVPVYRYAPKSTKYIMESPIHDSLRQGFKVRGFKIVNEEADYKIREGSYENYQILELVNLKTDESVWKKKIKYSSELSAGEKLIKCKNLLNGDNFESL